MSRGLAHLGSTGPAEAGTSMAEFEPYDHNPQ